MNGSPVNPDGQLQMGLWFMTSHLALTPQAPEQGLAHLNLWHARFDGHSELTTHSGLQFGGEPVYSGRQEHTAWSFTFRHWL